MKLYKHQQKGLNEIIPIIKKYNCCYLSGETRSGKTLTVLSVAQKLKVKKLLFITKKKAISSIEDDYKLGKFSYKLTVINYESIHKIDDRDFNLVIYDESHSLKKFPRPAIRTKYIKKEFSHIPCIWMSGTPAIESYSEWFHQFWVSDYSPFKKYKNFYRWADDFVDKKTMYLGTHQVTDYSIANEKMIDKIINPFKVIMKKPKEDFIEPNEHFLYVNTPKIIRKLIKILLEDRAIEGKTGFIMGETPAKLQSKVHQLENGSVILEDGIDKSWSKILSNYKAEFIRDNFKNKKIAIIFYYQAEREILINVFKDDITEDLDEFNKTDKSFILQYSTTEGMNLSKADSIVYFSLGFSGKDYLQSRDRLTIKGRKKNDVYFIFSKGGIMEKIYKTISKKKDYNSLAFRKDFL